MTCSHRVIVVRMFSCFEAQINGDYALQDPEAGRLVLVLGAKEVDH